MPYGSAKPGPNAARLRCPRKSTGAGLLEMEGQRLATPDLSHSSTREE